MPVQPPTVLEEFRERKNDRLQDDKDFRSGKKYSERLKNIRLNRQLVDERFLNLQGGRNHIREWELQNSQLEEDEELVEDLPPTGIHVAGTVHDLLSSHFSIRQSTFSKLDPMRKSRASTFRGSVMSRGSMAILSTIQQNLTTKTIQTFFLECLFLFLFSCNWYVQLGAVWQAWQGVVFYQTEHLEQVPLV